MRRGKPKNKKKYSSSVAVNNNNNIVLVESKQDHDSSGNPETEKCEIVHIEESVPSQKDSNSASSIPPICQEFLDVVSGMGLKIVPGQEMESQNSKRNEKPISQHQWNKSSLVHSSKSNKAQNSSILTLTQPTPGIKKQSKDEEKLKDEVFRGKSNLESVRLACYKKPPGMPNYAKQQQLPGRSFLNSKLDAIKLKETKSAKVKESNVTKGGTTDQSNLKVEGNKNKKPMEKKNATFVILNKKNLVLNDSRLQDPKSEVKMKSSNCVDAAHKPAADPGTHDVSWDIDKYKNDHEPTLRWHFKKKFLENNKEKYPEEELVSLAQVFCNTLFLGCTYSQETMQLVKQLGSDLAAEYKEMKHLNYVANLPSEAPKAERSAQPDFYCTDIRYRKSTQSFINQESTSSIKPVYQDKCIKQVSQISKKELSHGSAKQKCQISNNQVYESCSKQGLVTHQKINSEKIVKSIEELEPAIVDAAYNALNSSKPTFSLRSSDLHERVLRTVGHVPHFTKVRLHDILMKHPSSFKIGSRPFKADKNPTIHLLWNEEKTSDDRDTDASLYAGVGNPTLVNYDQNSFEFDEDYDDTDVLYSKEETILTLDSELKTPKAANEMIVTLTESDAEEALKENVDWVDLVEERDHDQLKEFSEKVLSRLNKLKSVEKSTKLVANDLKKLPVNESQDKLDQCAGLILGLAVDDQTLTESCADLCKSLEAVKAPKEGRVGEFVNFRRLLLLKLQFEFEKTYSSVCATKRDQKLLEREKASLLGIVKFVGEIYRVSMLTAAIVDECLSKLIVDSNDVLLEAGGRLLAAVGLKFKTETRINDETGKVCGVKKVDAYFKQLQDIYQSRKLNSSLSNLLKKIIFS